MEAHTGAGRSDRSNWSLAELGAGAFFVVYLGFQLAFPVYRLAAGGFQRFGWQMFARANLPPTYVLMRSDGTQDTVPLGTHIGNWRGDLDYSGDLISEQLCRLYPEAEEIVIRTRDDLPDRGYRCR
ncbi:MAG: hypothetical protein ACE5JR_09015 [Gemmatimonadota bacterium]